MSTRLKLTRVTYRFVAGRPLDGKARTDATYLRRATRVLTPTGRASRWSRLPGWRRQVARLGPPLAAAGAVHEPVYTVTAAAALAALGVVKARRAWRMRRFHRAYTRPTLAALRHALGGAEVVLRIDPALGKLTERLAPKPSPAEREWRARYAKHVEPVVRYLPHQVWRKWTQAKRRATPVTARLERWRRPVKDHGPCITFSAPGRQWLTDDQRAHVAAIIAGKVPVTDLASPQWDSVGPTVTARWTVRKQPPTKVGRADFEARTAGLPEHEYWLGLAAGGQSVKINLINDNPHIGISAAAGAGKSVMAMLLIVQTLQRGGEVYILDVKGSHRWALGLPGVTYCRTDQAIHDAWVKLAAAAGRRHNQAWEDPSTADHFRRVLIIAEELNEMMDALADHWNDVRESSRDKDPAVRAIRVILRMGRSVKVNIVAIAQRLSAAASGNGDARENLASALCLARFTPNTWKMLCSGMPMPHMSRVLGRWQIVTGGEATETQVCFLDDDDARLMVLASAPAPSSACPPGHENALIGHDQGLSAGQAFQADTPADPLSELLTLKEAADQRTIPWAAEAARKRFKRAQERDSPTLPQPRGKRGQGDLYTVRDLIVWAESERVK